MSCLSIVFLLCETLFTFLQLLAAARRKTQTQNSASEDCFIVMKLITVLLDHALNKTSLCMSDSVKSVFGFSCTDF